MKIKVHKTLILPVALYGCEVSSVTLREEHRLRFTDYTLPRKIFGSKKDEATGQLRRLRKEALCDQYTLPNIIRMRWARHLACMGDWKGAYCVLMGRPEERRPS